MLGRRETLGMTLLYNYKQTKYLIFSSWSATLYQLKERWWERTSSSSHRNCIIFIIVILPFF